MFDAIKRVTASHVKTKEFFYAFVVGSTMWIITVCLYATSDQTWNSLGAIGSLLAGLVSVGAGIWGMVVWAHKRSASTTQAIEQVRELKDKIEYVEKRIGNVSSKMEDVIRVVNKTSSDQRLMNVHYNYLKDQSRNIKEDLERIMDAIMRPRIGPIMEDEEVQTRTIRHREIVPPDESDLEGGTVPPSNG